MGKLAVMWTGALAVTQAGKLTVNWTRADAGFVQGKWAGFAQGGREGGYWRSDAPRNAIKLS